MNHLAQQIRALCKQKNAIILAHYYQRPEIQDVADFVGDSLALAQYAATTQADIIIMCGVHFMAETAKILCPDKKVLIPEPDAGCSLADSCNAKDLKKWKEEHPEHMIVSYVNTSAEVKALTDVVVTSSNALQIVNKLPKDQPILFGPDQNLGAYINAATGREMELWNGGCHVHARFSVEALIQLKQQYPNAKVLAHPECKATILQLADVVGSTQALLNYAKEHPEQKQFIVATESGILHEMQKACPETTFVPVPPEMTEDIEKNKQPIANQCGCNKCEYMRMNTLEKLYVCIKDERPEVMVKKEIADDAVKSIKKMLEWSK